jgi:hypothetical protein
MVMGKANEGTERGADMDPAALDAMSRFNEDLINAGVLVALGGLTPSSSGRRVIPQGDGVTVVDGPFAETKELIAGFLLLEVEDLDEATAWIMRAPKGLLGPNGLEIRPLMGMAEFEALQTPQTREIRERVRAKLGAA